MGLKIALTTLNTGRLALPAICLGVSKLSTKIAREWSKERVQWGQPVGKHDAVAQKIAFIAATSFGLEAMLDVSSRLADDKKHDIRIEAALAKLYGSELGWQVTDELMQVRGGRGYETAESLQARGEKPVPVEQMMRDMRINRIFEGSTEIMHLLIAREAVDQHLEVRGRAARGRRRPQGEGALAVESAKFYSRWLPQLTVGKGQRPGSYEEFGALAGHVRYAERASRKLARSTVLRDDPLAGEAREEAGVLGRIVDIGAELYAISAAAVYAQTLREEHPERGDEAVELADLFIRQARRRVETLFGELFDNDDDANYKVAQQVLEGRHTWLEEGIADPSGDGPMIAEQPRRCPRRADRAPQPQGKCGSTGGSPDVRDQAVRAQGQPSAAQSVGLAGRSSARRSSRSWCTSGGAGSTPMTIVFLVGALGYLLLAAFVPGVMGWQSRRAPVRVDPAVLHGAADLGADVRLPAQGRPDFEPLEERAAAVAQRTTEGASR
jgi:hypothetical protein